MCPDKQPKWDLLLWIAIGMLIIVAVSIGAVAHASPHPRMRIEIYDAYEPKTTIEEKQPIAVDVSSSVAPEPRAKRVAPSITIGEAQDHEDRITTLEQRVDERLREYEEIRKEETAREGGAGDDPKSRGGL